MDSQGNLAVPLNRKGQRNSMSIRATGGDSSMYVGSAATGLPPGGPGNASG